MRRKKKIKAYDYLVSYHCKTGTGTIIPTLKYKISCIDDLTMLKKWIEEKNKIENVGIINYQLIGKKKVEGDYFESNDKYADESEEQC